MCRRDFIRENRGSWAYFSDLKTPYDQARLMEHPLVVFDLVRATDRQRARLSAMTNETSTTGLRTMKRSTLTSSNSHPKVIS